MNINGQHIISPKLVCIRKALSVNIGHLPCNGERSMRLQDARDLGQRGLCTYR